MKENQGKYLCQIFDIADYLQRFFRRNFTTLLFVECIYTCGMLSHDSLLVEKLGSFFIELLATISKSNFYFTIKCRMLKIDLFLPDINIPSYFSLENLSHSERSLANLVFLKIAIICFEGADLKISPILYTDFYSYTVSGK